MAELGSHCGAVVICRASPSQKAAIVSMMDEFELRRAGGRKKGWLGWYNRIFYGLKVLGNHICPCSHESMFLHVNRDSPHCLAMVSTLSIRSSLVPHVSRMSTLRLIGRLRHSFDIRAGQDAGHRRRRQ